MKVIFLDHDGVMCLSQQWGGRSKKKSKWYKENGFIEDHHLPVSTRFDNFDPKAVRILNSILESTGAEIVVSSDWRFYCTLEEMKNLYKEYGIIKEPIDFTPRMRDFDEDGANLFRWKGWVERERVVEIRKWLELHPEVTAWVAVDDLQMGAQGLENFIHTPSSIEGIKKSGTKDKIIQFLEPEKVESEIRIFVQKLSNEARETKEAAMIVAKYMTGEKITEEEGKALKEQFYDVLKIAGIGVPFALIPGSTILLPLIVSFAKKRGINILPSSFEEKEK